MYCLIVMQTSEIIISAWNWPIFKTGYIEEIRLNCEYYRNELISKIADVENVLI